MDGKSLTREIKGKKETQTDELDGAEHLNSQANHSLNNYTYLSITKQRRKEQEEARCESVGFQIKSGANTSFARPEKGRSEKRDFKSSLYRRGFKARFLQPEVKV